MRDDIQQLSILQEFVTRQQNLAQRKGGENVQTLSEKCCQRDSVNGAQSKFLIRGKHDGSPGTGRQPMGRVKSESRGCFMRERFEFLSARSICCWD